MRFLFKIWSGYDGFTPAQLPNRLEPGRLLKLWWMRYMDPAGIGDEVWVYFHGAGVRKGVYAKGLIRAKDATARTVLLRVQDFATDQPLTDSETNERIAQVVARYGLQVFVYPDQWDVAPDCNVNSSATSCEKRSCRSCPSWRSLPIIASSDCALPHRILPMVKTVVPAYWVIPSRCFLFRDSRPISPAIRRSSDLFYRFKMGIARLAFPLAAGIYQALRARGLFEFDCIVPIPLSPDKAENREINRTLLLAKELGSLLGVDVFPALQLTRPTSKSILRTGLGLTPKQFETRYLEGLEVDERLGQCKRILLLDDVCTEGSTLRAAASAIMRLNPEIEITAAAAGQMILTSVVQNDAVLFASPAS